MTVVVVLVALAVAAWMAFVVQLKRRIGISLKQAFFYAPLKLIYRIEDTDASRFARVNGPAIYVVVNHSPVDTALALALLPDDTLHILDPEMSREAWLGSYKSLARTLDFNAEHLFVARRLRRVLKRKGRLAVYLPPDVEPDKATMRLYRAVARIARAEDAQVMPIAVNGSRFLPSSRVPAERAPRHRFPRLRLGIANAETITQGAARTPVPQTATNTLFDRVSLARFRANDPTRTLFTALLDAADRFGRKRIIVEDTVGSPLSYKLMFIGARVLGRRFAAMTQPGEVAGILLPNAGAVVVTLLALQSGGRIAAMLNYTAGALNIAAALETARIKTVISSRAFVEKAQLEPLVQAIERAGATIVWLDDLRETITLREKLLAALNWRRPLRATAANDPAVILFTSGSEGTPKGVVLSHRNLLANAHQAEARISISVRDCLFNVLPVFHSFGLTGGTILPLVHGIRLFLYPSPLHYKIIPQAAAKVQPTIMFGTDTFLAGYARSAKNHDFASLRFIVAGAEAVKPETRDVYQRRFDTAILEGFGMTEAAPVVSVNSSTHNRHGSVGRLLAGMEMRIEPVEGIDEGGRLWVKGPNVMLGYMTADRPGEIQPLADGWHDTGDVVSVDREGFIVVAGRLKRFAKIAGEMISLGAVEMLVKSLWPEDDHAAVSVPDRRKGERIVLLTTTRDADRGKLRDYSRESGVPELMVPNEIIKVPQIPVLGSGKVDYVSARHEAMEHSSE
ncbi:MAG: AMP-binding protein [Brucellaceae bacterium]|nr:AMP-binding protein [Brucellaceae bacterium]